MLKNSKKLRNYFLLKENKEPARIFESISFVD
jgi:hypothetical protein